MAAAPDPLGQLSPAQFLRDYWQQQPLLLRQVLSDHLPTLSADELAGLACETDVESRLILEKDGPHPWSLEDGPFDEQRFASLPTSHWTLLVQDVDKYIPQIAELLQWFRFVPDWRIDDVMISYATDQGSVGPHVDNYDVFLLQTRGKRRWQISTAPIDPDNRVAQTPLHILSDFTAEQEWVLEPGDMLYLPPGVAHHGVAEGECMTCSIGFRAPSHADLLGNFVDDYLIRQNVSPFYQDPGRPLPDHPAHLDSRSLGELRAVLRLQQQSDAELNTWLGSYLTEPKQSDAVLPLEPPLDHHAVKSIIDRLPVLVRNPWARLAYTLEAGQLMLFVAGHSLALPKERLDLVQWLSDHSIYDLRQLPGGTDDPDVFRLLHQLINLGVLLIDEPD